MNMNASSQRLDNIMHNKTISQLFNPKKNSYNSLLVSEDKALESTRVKKLQEIQKNLNQEKSGISTVKGTNASSMNSL